MPLLPGAEAFANEGRPKVGMPPIVPRLKGRPAKAPPGMLVSHGRPVEPHPPSIAMPPIAGMAPVETLLVKSPPVGIIGTIGIIDAPNCMLSPKPGFTYKHCHQSVTLKCILTVLM